MIIKNIIRYLVLTVLFILLVFSITGCSGSTEIKSGLQKSELRFDGVDDDWNISPARFENDNLSLRISNDEKFLYLCLVAEDKQKALQIFCLGLTVWFDKNGKNDEIFGIHYPVGMGEKGMKAMMGNLPGNRNQIQESSEQLFEDLKESLKKIEIIGPGNDKVEKFAVEDLRYIKAVVGNMGQSMVYELKVPLKNMPDFTYTIGADSMSDISIGLKTGSFDLNNVQSNTLSNASGNQSGESSGGRRGRSGSASGGQRKSGNDPRPKWPKDIEIWVKVSLSK